MKTIVKLLLVCLLAFHASAAIPAGALWRTWSTGSDTNGGFFVAGGSGTDWSTATTAHYAVTDAVTAGTTTITSASASFGTDVVDNGCYVSGGTGSITAGRYRVVSRTNATTIVVDRSTGLTTGTGVTLNCGGAVATLGEAVGTRGWAASNVVFVKATATYTVTATTTIASGVNDLANASPNYIIGYTTTDFDGGRVTISTSSAITMITNNMNNITYENFVLDAGNTATTGFDSTGAGNGERGLRIINFLFQNGFGTRAINAGNISLISKSRVTGMKSGCTSAIKLTGGTVSDTVVDGGACKGFSSEGASVYGIEYLRDVATGITGVGFDANSALGFVNFDGIAAYNCTSDGLSVGVNYQNISVVNSSFMKNGGYGINFGVNQLTKDLRLDYNAFGSGTMVNTSGAIHNMVQGAHDVTGVSVDPYTNAAALDFSLNSSNPGGAQLRGAGFPGVTQFGTGFRDIGPLAHLSGSGTDYPRSISDGTLTVVLARSFGPVRTAADLSVSEAAARSTVYGRTAADLTLSEAVARLRDVPRSVAELSVSETVARLYAALRAATDGTLSEAIGRSQGFPRAMSDGTVSESTARLLIASRTASDLSMSEAVSRSEGFQRNSMADGTLSEIVNRLGVFNRSAADSGFVSVVVLNGRAFNVNLSDGALSVSVARSPLQLARTVSDSSLTVSVTRRGDFGRRTSDIGLASVGVLASAGGSTPIVVIPLDHIGVYPGLGLVEVYRGFVKDGIYTRPVTILVVH